MLVFLQKLYDDGFIYKGEYEGYYCVGCEEYKQLDDLVDGTGDYAGQLVCKIHGRPVESAEEQLLLPDVRTTERAARALRVAARLHPARQRPATRSSRS